MPRGVKLSERESNKEEMLFIGCGGFPHDRKWLRTVSGEPSCVKLSGLIGKYGCGEEELQELWKGRIASYFCVDLK